MAQVRFISPWIPLRLRSWTLLRLNYQTFKGFTGYQRSAAIKGSRPLRWYNPTLPSRPPSSRLSITATSNRYSTPFKYRAFTHDPCLLAGICATKPRRCLRLEHLQKFATRYPRHKLSQAAVSSPESGYRAQQNSTRGQA